MLTSVALIALAATASTVSATRLYVSSYTGNITTFDFTKTGNATYDLARLDTTIGCSPNASWLQIDVKHRNLFCLDEGIVVANGSLASFKINDDKIGSLKLVNNASVPAAPVHSALYNGPNGTQLLAVAHYTHALTTYKIDPLTASFTPHQSINFTMDKPGPKPQQAAPHPHQAVIDPQRKYLVIPDLGADLLRVFHINSTTLQLHERPSIPVEAGSGPRHGVFHTTRRSANKRGETHFFLLTEISSKIAGYNVTYLPDNGGLQFKPSVSPVLAYGTDPLPPAIAAGNAPAEIAIGQTKNGSQLIVSNRNATFFNNVKNPDANNATTIVSDSLATFSLPSSSQSQQIAFNALTPAGGLFPRHFALNAKGDKIAVGLQRSGRVVIYDRCPETGMICKDPVAGFEGLGEVSNIVWDEGRADLG
ncbi:MAG: hypothetical protein Q9209_007311 [Squamulea sp. 1 TL-2023]